MGKGIVGHTAPFMGKTNDWITPLDVTKPLGKFDLDPCSSLTQPWFHAETNYTIEDDGFNKEWFGRVWMNPPYGSETAKWLKKLADYGNGIALIFARTETKMFFDFCWNKADSFLFLKNRLYFHRPDGTRATSNSGGPSVLIAYGENNSEALLNSGHKGAFVKNIMVI